MFLDKIAQQNLKEKFIGYNPDTDEFTAGEFKARMGPTDRFLSIYNRPTRMRQMFLKPTTLVPLSQTVKHTGTGDIYLLGTERQDARWDVNKDEPYIGIILAHLVTPNGKGTSGLFTLSRKLMPQLGEFDTLQDMLADPLFSGRNIYEVDGKIYGWLADTVIERCYGDVEFRTTKAEPGTFDNREGDYYGWFPATTNVEKKDKLSLDGKDYFVAMEYTDAGFTGVTLGFRSEYFNDFTYVGESSRTYNRQTGDWETIEDKKEVSGIVYDDENKSAWSTGSVSNIKVAINTNHIGFIPKVDDHLEYDGWKRKIKSVSLQASESQYMLVCE